MNAPKKVMRIGSIDYVEKKTKAKQPCQRCVFGRDWRGCFEAIEKSPQVFGDDCEGRDVIYVGAA